MAVQPIPGPEWAYELVAGPWPPENEDQIRALADAWQDLTQALLDVVDDGTQVAWSVLSVVDAPSVTAFVDRWNGLVDGENSSIGQLVEQAAQFKGQLDNLATDIEYTKLSMNIALVAMYIQIAWAIASMAITWGASLGFAFLAIRITQSAFLRLLEWLLGSVATMLLPDLISQEILINEGHQTGWDWKKTVPAAITAGAVGGLGPLLGKFAGRVVPLLAEHPTTWSQRLTQWGARGVEGAAINTVFTAGSDAFSYWSQDAEGRAYLDSHRNELGHLGMTALGGVAMGLTFAGTETMKSALDTVVVRNADGSVAFEGWANPRDGTVVTTGKKGTSTGIRSLDELEPGQTVSYTHGATTYTFGDRPEPATSEPATSEPAASEPAASEPTAPESTGETAQPAGVTEHVSAGEVSADHVSTDQVSTDQVATGHVSADQVATDHVSTDQVSAGQVAPDTQPLHAVEHSEPTTQPLGDNGGSAGGLTLLHTRTEANHPMDVQTPAGSIHLTKGDVLELHLENGPSLDNFQPGTILPGPGDVYALTRGDATYWMSGAHPAPEAAIQRVLKGDAYVYRLGADGPLVGATRLDGTVPTAGPGFEAGHTEGGTTFTREGLTVTIRDGKVRPEFTAEPESVAADLASLDEPPVIEQRGGPTAGSYRLYEPRAESHHSGQFDPNEEASPGQHGGQLDGQHGTGELGQAVVAPATERLDFVSDASTTWRREPDGWYITHESGSLDIVGDDGQPVTVQIPEGSRALVDSSNQLRAILQPDGVSYDRGLGPAGQWSRRVEPGEVVVNRAQFELQLPLQLDDGTVLYLRSGDEIRDVVTGQTLAYLSDGHVYVPAGNGRWTETAPPAAEVQGWLAAANKAFEAAHTLFDIAGRSDLPKLDGPTLAEMAVHGGRDDAAAAIYELVSRVEGKQMRWTQMDAVDALLKGEMIQMRAGEGKSLAFYAFAGRELASGEHDSVMMITSLETLAAREFKVYQRLYEGLGYDIVEIKGDGTTPLPVEGRKTIYVGTVKKVGFEALLDTRSTPLIGRVRVAAVDEADAVLIHSNTTFIISEGQNKLASAEDVAQVAWARNFLISHLADGSLTAADFGRTEGEIWGPARLTEDGRAKVEGMLDRALTDTELKRLNRAAAAEWQYIDERHYLVDPKTEKIIIIDQFNHELMTDLSAAPSKTSESRWTDGLAQALEQKHGLPVRADSEISKSTTARQIFSPENFDKVSGASGTNRGHGEDFAALGLSEHVREIQPYYESELRSYPDRVFVSEKDKIDAIVADTVAMHARTLGRGDRPQLIIVHENDLAAKISARLSEARVPHKLIDARWFLKKGPEGHAALEQVLKRAGELGETVIGNFGLGRGQDPTVSANAESVGGLHVRLTAHSAKSADIDLQALTRAGRNGQLGSAQVYVSAEDDLYRLTYDPDVQMAVTRYEAAVGLDRANPTPETREAVTQAGHVLRQMVPRLQAEAAARAAMHLRSPVLPDAPGARASANPSSPAPQQAPARQAAPVPLNNSVPVHSGPATAPASAPVAQPSTGPLHGAAPQPVAGIETPPASTGSGASPHTGITTVFTPPEHHGAQLDAVQAMAHQVPASQLPSLVHQALAAPVPAGELVRALTQVGPDTWRATFIDGQTLTFTVAAQPAPAGVAVGYTLPQSGPAGALAGTVPAPLGIEIGQYFSDSHTVGQAIQARVAHALAEVHERLPEAMVPLTPDDGPAEPVLATGALEYPAAVLDGSEQELPPQSLDEQAAAPPAGSDVLADPPTAGSDVLADQPPTGGDQAGADPRAQIADAYDLTALPPEPTGVAMVDEARAGIASLIAEIRERAATLPDELIGDAGREVERAAELYVNAHAETSQEAVTALQLALLALRHANALLAAAQGVPGDDPLAVGYQPVRQTATLNLNGRSVEVTWRERRIAGVLRLENIDVQGAPVAPAAVVAALRGIVADRPETLPDLPIQMDLTTDAGHTTIVTTAGQVALARLPRKQRLRLFWQHEIALGDALAQAGEDWAGEYRAALARQHGVHDRWATANLTPDLIAEDPALAAEHSALADIFGWYDPLDVPGRRAARFELRRLDAWQRSERLRLHAEAARRKRLGQPLPAGQLTDQLAALDARYQALRRRLDDAAEAADAPLPDEVTERYESTVLLDVPKWDVDRNLTGRLTLRVRVEVLRTAAGPTYLVAKVPIDVSQVPPGALEFVRARAQLGLAMLTEHVLAPRGWRVRVDLQPGARRASEASTVVLQPGYARATQRHWSLTDAPTVLAHEVLHFLGLQDHYYEPDRRTPGRMSASDRRILTGDTAMTTHSRPGAELHRTEVDELLTMAGRVVRGTLTDRRLPRHPGFAPVIDAVGKVSNDAATAMRRLRQPRDERNGLSPGQVRRVMERVAALAGEAAWLTLRMPEYSRLLTERASDPGVQRILHMVAEMVSVERDSKRNGTPFGDWMAELLPLMDQPQPSIDAVAELTDRMRLAAITLHRLREHLDALLAAGGADVADAAGEELDAADGPFTMEDSYGSPAAPRPAGELPTAAGAPTRRLDGPLVRHAQQRAELEQQWAAALAVTTDPTKIVIALDPSRQPRESAGGQEVPWAHQPDFDTSVDTEIQRLVGDTVVIDPRGQARAALNPRLAQLLRDHPEFAHFFQDARLAALLRHPELAVLADRLRLAAPRRRLAAPGAAELAGPVEAAPGAAELAGPVGAEPGAAELAEQILWLSGYGAELAGQLNRLAEAWRDQGDDASGRGEGRGDRLDALLALAGEHQLGGLRTGLRDILQRLARILDTADPGELADALADLVMFAIDPDLAGIVSRLTAEGGRDQALAGLLTGDPIVPLAALGQPAVVGSRDATASTVVGTGQPLDQRPDVIISAGNPAWYDDIAGAVRAENTAALDDVTPQRLAALSAQQRAGVVSRLRQQAAAHRPVEPGLARIWEDAPRLATEVPHVAGLTRVGNGWYLLRTTGGQQVVVGATRGDVDEGIAARTRRVTDAPQASFIVNVTASPGVELIDGFFDQQVNAELAAEHAEVLFAGQLAMLAAQLDAQAAVGALLDGAGTALAGLTAVSVGLDGALTTQERAEIRAAAEAARRAVPTARAALDSPSAMLERGASAVAALRTAAAGLAALASAYRAQRWVADALIAAEKELRDAADALASAADALGGADALRPAFGTAGRLSAADHRAVAELRVRARLLDQWERDPTVKPLTRWRGVRARRHRIAALIGRLGLDSRGVAREQRAELLRAAGYGDVVRIADTYGSAPAARPSDPMRIDPWWVTQTVPGLVTAVGADRIEPVDEAGAVFRVVYDGGQAFTVAVVLDGDAAQAAPQAELVIALEQTLEARPARWELAGRIGQAVELHRRATAAGESLAVMADRAADGELGPDLLVVHRLGAGVPEDAPLSPRDHGALGWLRAFRQDYEPDYAAATMAGRQQPGPSWRQRREMRRAFHEFAHDKGLLRHISPDYDRKLRAIADLDAVQVTGLAGFIKHLNQARPILSSLAEPGVDETLLYQARFDSAALPDLVTFLDGQLARQDLGVHRDENGELVVTGRVEAGQQQAIEVLRVRVRTTELFGPEGQLVRGQGPGSYEALIQIGVERRRGELAVVAAVYAAIADRAAAGAAGGARAEPGAAAVAHLATAGSDAVPHEVVSALALRQRHLAERSAPRAVLRSYLRAYRQELEASGNVDLDALPQQLRDFLNRQGRRRLLGIRLPESGRAIGARAQQFRAQIERGEQAPSRVPPLWRYVTHRLIDFGAIGIINTAIGLWYGMPPAVAASAVGFALIQSFVLARQSWANDRRGEQAQNAAFASEAAQRARVRQRQAQDAVGLIDQAVGPVVASLAGTPVPQRSGQRTDTDLWASRAVDPASGKTTYKTAVKNATGWLFWGSAQQVVYYGLATGQVGLAVSGVVTQLATVVFSALGEMKRYGYQNVNWNRQIAYDTALLHRRQREAQEAQARRLRHGLDALAVHTGRAIPQDAPPGRRPEDVWASGAVFDHRPRRNLTVGENIVQRFWGMMVPYGIGGLAVALTDPAATFVRLPQGAVNWLLGSWVSTTYDRAADARTDNVTRQQAAVAQAATRQFIDSLVSQFYRNVWAAITESVPAPEEGWAAWDGIPGESVGAAYVSPEQLASPLPSLAFIGAVTGAIPGVVEALMSFLVGQVAPVHPAAIGTAAQARAAVEANRVAVAQSPGSFFPGSHTTADLNLAAGRYNELYAQALDAAEAAVGTSRQAQAAAAARAARVLAETANQAVARNADFQTLFLGVFVEGLGTSITGPLGSYFFNLYLQRLISEQALYRVLSALHEIEQAQKDAFATVEDNIRRVLHGLASTPDEDAGTTHFGAAAGVAEQLPAPAPVDYTARVLQSRYEALTGQPVDPRTAEQLYQHALRVEAERRARVEAHRALTSGVSRLAKLRDAEQALLDALLRRGVEVRNRLESLRSRPGENADRIAALEAELRELRLDAGFQRRRVQQLADRLEAERRRVEGIQADLPAHPDQWSAFNPNVAQAQTGSVSGVVPAPDWQQQLIRELTEADAEGRIPPYSAVNAAKVGAVNRVRRGLEPGTSDSCVAVTEAMLATWYGTATAAQTRTFDGYANGDVTRPLLLGERDGAGRLEALHQGRFQEIVAEGTATAEAVSAAWAAVEAQLRLAGPGSAAVITLAWSDGSTAGHTTQAFFDGERVHYVDPGFDQPSHEPFFAAAQIAAMGAFVLNADRVPVPFAGRGRGLGNQLPPGEHYLQDPTVAALAQAWQTELDPRSTARPAAFRPGASPPAGGEQPAGPADPLRGLRDEVGRIAEELTDIGLDTIGKALQDFVVARTDIDRRVLRVLTDRVAAFHSELVRHPDGGLGLLIRPKPNQAEATQEQKAEAMRRLKELIPSLNTLAESKLLAPAPPSPERSAAEQLAESPRTANPVALDAPRLPSFSRMLQLLTDRAHRGDYTPEHLPESEYTGALGEPEDAAKYSPYRRTDADAFHGGNIAGLIEQLPYMRGMGIDTVWISPVTTTRTVISFGGFTGAGYHYYWPIDFLNVDPRQGTKELLQAFLDEAHKLGIKVVLDAVFEHSGIVNDPHGGVGATRMVWDPNRPHRDLFGRPVEPGDELDPDTYRQIVFFPFMHGYQVPEGLKGKLSPWWVDQWWWAYYRAGENTSEDIPQAKLRTDTFGLAHFFTEQPAVRWGLQDIALYWLLAGFDGFRYDTANHVNVEFWAELNPLLRAWAEQLGRPNGFITFGEAFIQDPHQLADLVARGLMAGMIDFPVQKAVVSFAMGQGIDLLLWVLGADVLFTTPRGNAHNLVLPISSHDDLGHFAGQVKEELYPYLDKLRADDGVLNAYDRAILSQHLKAREAQVDRAALDSAEQSVAAAEARMLGLARDLAGRLNVKLPDPRPGHRDLTYDAIRSWSRTLYPGSRNQLAAAIDELTNALDDVARASQHYRELLPPGVVTELLTQADAGVVRRVNLAYSMVYFLPRISNVYHGDDQGLAGKKNENSGLNAPREDLDPSEVEQYAAAKHVGTDATGADANFDTNHPIYQHLARLAEMVRQTPAMKTGAFTRRRARRDDGGRMVDDPDVYAFSRIDLTAADPNARVEHVGLVNPSEKAIEVVVDTYSADMAFEPLFGEVAPVTSARDGRLTVTVPPLSAVVYRATQAVTVPAEPPTVKITLAPKIGPFRSPFEPHPTLGPRAHDRIPIGAEVAWGHRTGVPAQLSFYVRRVGEPEWTYLGTTDSEPHAVLPYASDYPPGTRLEVLVMAKDIAGRVASDSLVMTVGAREALPPPPNAKGLAAGWGVVNYYRPDGDYQHWALRLRLGPAEELRFFTNESSFGRFAYAKLPATNRPDELAWEIVNVKTGELDGHGSFAHGPSRTHVREFELYNRARMIIVNSEHMLREAQWLFQRDDADIVILPNGTDLAPPWNITEQRIDQLKTRHAEVNTDRVTELKRLYASDTNDPAIRTQLQTLLNEATRDELMLSRDLPTDDHVVMFWGRLVYEKGVRHTIEAMSEVVKRHPNTVFAIVGDGKVRRDLEKQVRELHLEQHVKFLGSIRHHEGLPQLAAAADQVNFPSDYEPFGIVNLEAMACGTPVVTSGTGVVANEETGLLVPARDPAAMAEAIIRLIENKDNFARELGKRGRDEARKPKYRWANIAARRIGIYRQAMRKPRRPRDVPAPVIPVNGNIFDVARVHLIGRRRGEKWRLWHESGSHNPMPPGSSRPPDGFDEWGPYWDIPLKELPEDQRTGTLRYTIHREDGPSIAVNGDIELHQTISTGRGVQGHQVWLDATEPAHTIASDRPPAASEQAPATQEEEQAPATEQPAATQEDGPLKIVHFSWEYPKAGLAGASEGGVGPVVVNTAEEQAKAGHDVWVITRRRPGVPNGPTELVDQHFDRRGNPVEKPVEGGGRLRVLLVALPPGYEQRHVFDDDPPAWSEAVGKAMQEAAFKYLTEHEFTPNVVDAHDWLATAGAFELAEASKDAVLVAHVHATEAGRQAGWLLVPQADGNLALHPSTPARVAYIVSGDPVVHRSEVSATGYLGVHVSEAGNEKPSRARLAGRHRGPVFLEGVDLPPGPRGHHYYWLPQHDSRGQYGLVPVDHTGTVAFKVTNLEGDIDQYDENGVQTERVWNTTAGGHVYVVHGHVRMYDSLAGANNEVVIRFRVPRGGEGERWQLRQYDGAAQRTENGQPSRDPDARDSFGLVWTVQMGHLQRELTFEIHDQNGHVYHDKIELNQIGNQIWRLPDDLPMNHKGGNQAGGPSAPSDGPETGPGPIGPARPAGGPAGSEQRGPQYLNYTAADLARRVEALTGRPVDAEEAAALRAYAQQMADDRAARMQAHLRLIAPLRELERQWAAARADLRELVRQAAEAEDRLAAALRAPVEVDDAEGERPDLIAALRSRLTELRLAVDLQHGRVARLSASVGAERWRVRDVQADLAGSPEWSAFNPNAPAAVGTEQARPAGVAAADWQQELVEELTAAEAGAVAPHSVSNVEKVIAVNRMMSELEFGYDNNCVAVAEAAVQTWYGSAKAAGARTFDGYAGSVFEPLPLGERGGGARLEERYGGRFQAVAQSSAQVDAGWRRIEAQLATAGAGSVAVVMLRWADGTDHVTLAFYDGHAVSYVDPGFGQPSRQPLFRAEQIAEMGTFVLDGDAVAVPFPDLGAGLGNADYPGAAAPARQRHRFEAVPAGPPPAGAGSFAAGQPEPLSESLPKLWGSDGNPFDAEVTIDELSPQLEGHPDLKQSYPANGVPLHAKVSAEFDGRLKLDFRFRTAGGDEKGSALVHIHLGEDGRLRAVLQQMNLQVQGQGVAKAFHRGLERFLAQAGVVSVSLKATQIGRYAWARLGYEFASSAERQRVLDAFRARASGFSAQGQADWKALADRLATVRPDELARIGRDAGDGRAVLLGDDVPEWNGVLVLAPLTVEHRSRAAVLPPHPEPVLVRPTEPETVSHGEFHPVPEPAQPTDRPVNIVALALAGTSDVPQRQQTAPDASG